MKRREFFKAGLVGATLPALTYGNSELRRNQKSPVIITTHNFPKANAAAIEVLKKYGSSMDAAEAHAMLDASKQYPGQIAQVVPAPHTLNLDKTIVNLIQNNYLGDIISVDASISQGGFLDNEKLFHWRQNRDFSGSNIMGLGICTPYCTPIAHPIAPL